MISVPLSVLDLSVVSAGQTSSDALHATLELARVADEHGYERFWTAEHHNMASIAATSPAVMIAALGAATSRIRIGSGGVMLPNHSPYAVAEQFAMLEALYPGRVDLGLGRAPGTDQVTAWALRRTQEGLGEQDFPRDVELVRAWLSEQGVSAGPGHELKCTPAAAGFPALWLLGSSDYSARLAGRYGMNFAYAGHFGELDPATVIEMYRSAFEPSELLSEPHSMLAVSAITADTNDRAQWFAGPARVRWLGMRTGRRLPLPTPEDAERQLGAQATEIPAVNHVGTARDVTDALNEVAERTGVDELMVTCVTYDLATRVETLRNLSAGA